MPGKLADAGYAHAQIPSNIGETLNNKTSKTADGKKIKKEQAWLRMIRGKTRQIAKDEFENFRLNYLFKTPH